MKRLLVITLLGFSSACSDMMVGPPPKTDRASLFDNLWSEVDIRYPYFDYKGIDWNAIGARYRPQALAATNDTAFAAVLGSMLAELQDVHVALTPFGPSSQRRYISPIEMQQTYYDIPAIQKQLISPQFSSGGHLQYGMIAPAVGYVRIASFLDDGWSGEIDEAVHGLPAARTLVVDVRENGGGNRTLAIALAGHFAAEPRTFSYLRFRNGPSHSSFTEFVPQTLTPAGVRFKGDVQVLANRHTVSAAEDFVLAMRSLPNVSVIGDTTAGATGGPIPRELANGWTYQISEWIQYTPEKRIFEGIGLAPDVVVRASLDDAKAHRDPALVRAVAIALHTP